MEIKKIKIFIELLSKNLLLLHTTLFKIYPVYTFTSSLISSFVKWEGEDTQNLRFWKLLFGSVTSTKQQISPSSLQSSEFLGCFVSKYPQVFITLSEGKNMNNTLFLLKI